MDARTELNQRYEASVPMTEAKARSFQREFEKLYQDARFIVAMDPDLMSYVVVQIS